jgi:hypothetical protein
MNEQDVCMVRLYHSSIYIVHRILMESMVQIIHDTKVLIMMLVNVHLQSMAIAIDHISLSMH